MLNSLKANSLNNSVSDIIWPNITKVYCFCILFGFQKNKKAQKSGMGRPIPLFLG